MNKILGIEDGSESDLRFMVYSAHDDQVTNMLSFLGVDFYWVPYASTVTFELKYSLSCLNSDSPSVDCFGVGIRSNGAPLLFDQCTGDNFSLEGCKWSEFENLMSELWYSGADSDDLDAACF